MFTRLLKAIPFLFLAMLGPAHSQPPTEEPRVVPYSPYYHRGRTLNQYLEREQARQVYVVAGTPLRGSALDPEAPVELTLTFNQPIDPKTLPPQAPAWKLHTPQGVIDPSNLSEYGAFKWNAEPNEQQLIPNTLVFQFHNKRFPGDQPLEFRLELSEPPRSVGGFEALDFDHELSYASWSFRLDPFPVTSNVEGSMIVEARAPEGTTAHLEPPRPPLTLRGSLDDEEFALEYYETRPHPYFAVQERIWQLVVPEPDKLTPGSTPPLFFRYRERYFERPVEVDQVNASPRASDWIASQARVESFQIEGDRVRAVLVLQAKPAGPEAEGDLDLILRLDIRTGSTGP